MCAVKLVHIWFSFFFISYRLYRHHYKQFQIQNGVSATNNSGKQKNCADQSIKSILFVAKILLLLLASTKSSWSWSLLLLLSPQLLLLFKLTKSIYD